MNFNIYRLIAYPACMVGTPCTITLQENSNFESCQAQADKIIQDIAESLFYNLKIYVIRGLKAKKYEFSNGSFLLIAPYFK
ncbi:hypothetical protein G7B40_031535 [Aetokthonos hydrillicola Thurmond2011]|jgi:hypothetical protein|uniref:Uncharacterized protein n=1 Tax=Aetokthonos hydrillicola Thurmond2011 TaxID=2712845 RepID=A0AAP5MDA6_9CYAN|nr:hypothetical protein [Aetokthonos hydrillicola]MBO3462862.1 hypothetical protein [Aetokthonos hydrillicola CCALA 1050]MBW4590971.1 hypothetical protein [Aetokthonos hydrillicola CCALA 1050]MDR9899059.1 hypothetical protein [Aetokthonos hydrillicola Thurmond2011]